MTHLFEPRAHGAVDHVPPLLGQAPAAGVELHGRFAVHEQIVLHAVVAAAADQHGARAAQEDVAEYRGPAGAVVEIDRPHAVVAVAKDAQVVKEVVPHHIAPLGPVAAHVEGAGVAGLRAHVVDLVELDHMVIAVQQHRGVGRVVQVVVRDAVAHAVQVDPRRVGEQPAAEAVDVAVLDHVAGRLQRTPVAAGQLHAAGAGVADPAPLDAVAGAPIDPDAVFTGVADIAAADPGVPAAGDADAVAAATLDRQAVQMHVRCAAQGDHRLRQERHRDDHFVRRRIARRPEVEQPGPPVQVPLAGGVELLQDVQKVVALPGGVSVGAGPIGGDQPGVEVDRLDALVGVGPVIGPVAVHQRLGRTAPAARPVAEVLEAAIGFVAAGVPRHVVGTAASRRVDAGDGHE